MLALKSSEKVLDVACGTGVTTRMAKHQVGASGVVEGLDINASMLAAAKALAKDLNIGWLGNPPISEGPAE